MLVAGVHWPTYTRSTLCTYSRRRTSGLLQPVTGDRLLSEPSDCQLNRKCHQCLIEAAAVALFSVVVIVHETKMGMVGPPSRLSWRQTLNADPTDFATPEFSQLRLTPVLTVTGGPPSHNRGVDRRNRGGDRLTGCNSPNAKLVWEVLCVVPLRHILYFPPLQALP